MSEPAALLEALDAAALTPLVRLALDLDDADVTDWRHDPFGHSLDAVGGTARSIFRFSGSARTGGRSTPWSMVLKIVTAPATPGDPASPANGEREPLAYASGLLDGIGGVTAPRCFAVLSQPTGGAWVWLEDIVEAIGHEWPQERYLLAARHLARFNGAHPAGRPSLAYPWLSRSPLREAVRQMSPAVGRIREARDHPLVGTAISEDAAATLLGLLDDVERWLDRLDDMPPVLCHWDAHRANLASRTGAEGAVETVAFDWAGIGWGPAGADLSKLLSQAVNFFGLPADALPALDARLFEAYLHGLRETGWRGDARSVRLAYVVASAARLIVRTASALDLAFDARARAAFERAAGVPFASLAATFRRTLPYYLSHVDEARGLF